MRKRIIRTVAAALLFLAGAAGVLSGCGKVNGPAETKPEPSASQPVPTLSPEEEAAAEARAQRLAAQEDGFLLDKGYLYAVDGQGELRRDVFIGILYFGEDGRYTSGSKDLDRLVAATIRKHTDDEMTRMEKLRAMYNYTRDNIKYVGLGNHENR